MKSKIAYVKKCDPQVFLLIEQDFLNL